MLFRSKTQIVEAMRAFISQRSGIEWGNYGGSREAFMGDYRPILKRGKQARELLRAVELRESITAENIIAGTRAYSGRLQFVERDGGIGVEYTTGQYFPTEYRAAACAVLACVLWEFWYEDNKEGKPTPRQAIQKIARREFGPAMARDWFN